MTIPEEENGEIEYACPVCGAGVSGDAERCDSCGEVFAVNGVNGNGMINGDVFESEISEMDEELAAVEAGEDYVEADDESVEVGEDYIETGEEHVEAEFTEEVTVEETTETEYLPVDEDEEADPGELEMDEEMASVEASELEVEDQDYADDEDSEEEAELLDEPEEKTCPGCDTLLGPDDEACPECGEPVPISGGPEEASDGCPSCGSKDHTAQQGDMVSCDNCGNVYLHELKFEGPDTSWKWKFWLGLIFILVGDFGFALVSYLHNAARWSPLGDMYLGYGWMDTMLGAVGVTLFIVGLVLFAWSFKREREVDCPSCGIHIKESDLLPSPDEEEEEEEGVHIEDVMGQIEDVAECPDCGSPVTIFDIECSECGAQFETDEYEEEIIEEEFVEEATFEAEGTGPAGELSEEDLIIQSLEFEEEPVEVELEAEPEIEPENVEVLEEMESLLTLNGLNGELDLESDSDVDLDLGPDSGSGLECPECSSMIDAGSKECPVCGSAISDGGVE